MPKPKGVERGLLPLEKKDCFMMASKRLRIGGWVAGVLLAIVLALSPQGAAAETLELQPLIAEALANNRELRAAESRIAAAGFRITQARGLPDPMVSIGYQNEGLTNYTYGNSPDAQRMTK